MISREKQLIAFEEKIANLFNSSKISSPIHLYYGNEKQIIKVFNNIKKSDWVFCSWRSHYQCLLKGVPERKLLSEILDGKSISLCFPDFRIYSSAIVGGHIPIAVGVAIGIKRKKLKEKVYVFLGDMTAETGIMHESLKYSINHDLPIHFIIEDNGLSVCTNTNKVWGNKQNSFYKKNSKFITYYKYKNKYPHAGAGIRVQF